MRRGYSPASRSRKEASCPSFLYCRPFSTSFSRNLVAFSAPQAYQRGVNVTERLMLLTATFPFHFGCNKSSQEIGTSFLATRSVLYARPQWRVNGPAIYFPCSLFSLGYEFQTGRLLK